MGKVSHVSSPAWLDRTDVVKSYTDNLNRLAYSSDPLPILLSFVVFSAKKFPLTGSLREVHAFLHKVTQLKSHSTQNLPLPNAITAFWFDLMPGLNIISLFFWVFLVYSNKGKYVFSCGGGGGGE